jgi:hypothetical protein
VNSWLTDGANEIQLLHKANRSLKLSDYVLSLP